MQRLERVPFHGIVPVYVAVAVFTFVCGPSVHAVDEAGTTFRWAALFALPAHAAVWTFARREPPGLHSTVAGARNDLLRLVHDRVSMLGRARETVASLRRRSLSGAELGLAVALILSSAGTPDQSLGLAGVIAYAAATVVADLSFLLLGYGLFTLFPAVVGLPEPGQHPPSWPRGSR